MIHIVFEAANVAALSNSFSLDPSLEGEIIEIQDDYAVGPLGDIYSDEGQAARLSWWKEILEGGHYNGIADDGHVDDAKAVAALKAKLDASPEEEAWIWAAQNRHDVSGYYWLMSQLKDYQGRIFILYLNNLPFINEKGQLFYPTNLYQVQPREFVKAKKLARVITPSEFEVDPDEWAKLCHEEEGVRILEGGKKLVTRSYQYYDSELMKFIGKDWQKGNKVMQQYFSKSKELTGDAFLLWRLKQLVGSGKIEFQGDWKNMKEFQVRLSGIGEDVSPENTTGTVVQ